MVPPNGPAAARSSSTWIHWWSSVASANVVDALLVDRQPVAGADLLADGRGDLVEVVNVRMAAA